MPSAMLKIRSVEAKPAYRLAVSWSNGTRGTIDLGEMIRRGGVFTEISDFAKFSAVKIGENNRVVEWPKPSDTLGYPMIDIDAESLYATYRSQKEKELVSRIRLAVRLLAEKAYILPESHLSK